MAKIFNVKKFSDPRGNLAVVEAKDLGFEIKRVFYIWGADNEIRGRHAHKETIQAAVALNGSCKFYVNNGVKKEEFLLDSPDKFLLLEPSDWHYMYDFKDNCILEVFANKTYDPEDYIYDEPK
ncbi:MAG: WxcM-like domain-containing protein [Cyanobacteria bacterium SIG30]|nr:WxcM-like domain-containing protein [Cyanobacteria bacterium SIG30]